MHGIAELYSGYQRTILASALLMSLIVGGALAVFPDDLGEDDEYSCALAILSF